MSGFVVAGLVSHTRTRPPSQAQGWHDPEHLAVPDGCLEKARGDWSERIAHVVNRAEDAMRGAGPPLDGCHVRPDSGSW